MLKKIFVMLVFAIVAFASFGTAIAEEISEFQVEKIVEDYAREGEHVVTEVTIYHEGVPYYVVGFMKEDMGKGCLIVNRNTGEIIRDDGIASEIFYTYTRNIGPDFRTEGLEDTLARLNVERLWIAEVEIFADNMETSIEELPYKCQKPTKDYVKTMETYVEGASMEIAIMEEIYEIQKSLVDKLETEKVRAFVAKNNELAEHYEKRMLGDFKAVTDAGVVYYDAMIAEAIDEEERTEIRLEKATHIAEYDYESQALKDEIDRWRREEREVMEGTELFHGVNWLIESMHDRLEEIKPTPSPTPTPTPTPSPTPTPTPTPPGFEAVFAIAGLLAMAHLLRRKR